jgi:hypothetical protein
MISTIMVLVISTILTIDVFAQTNESGPVPQPVKDWLAMHPNFTGCVSTDFKTGESKEISCLHPELSPMGLYVLTNSPLKQFKSGISPKDVTCNQGLQLFFKAEDNSPACVKADTAFHLSVLGWGYLPDPFITKTDLLEIGRAHV